MDHNHPTPCTHVDTAVAMAEVSDSPVELHPVGADVVGDHEPTVSLIVSERVQVGTAEATGNDGPHNQQQSASPQPTHAGAGEPEDSQEGDEWRRSRLQQNVARE